MSLSEIHFAATDAVSQTVRRRIASRYLDCSVRDIFQRDPIARTRVLDGSKPFLRPYLSHVACKSMALREGASDNPALQSRLESVMTAIELFNISTYQTDDVFDCDTGAATTHAASSRVVEEISASHLSFGLAMREVMDCAELSEGRKLDCLRLLERASCSVYRGQVFQRDTANVTSCIDKPLDEYLTVYLTRCRLLDGEQIAASFLLGLLARDPDAREDAAFENYHALGNLFGMALQLINDMREYIPDDPNVGRDLDAGICTFPIYMCMKNRMLDVSGTQAVGVRAGEGSWSLPDSLRAEVLLGCVKMLKALWARIRERVVALSAAGCNSDVLLFLYPHLFRSRFLRPYADEGGKLNRLSAKVGLDMAYLGAVDSVMKEVTPWG